MAASQPLQPTGPALIEQETGQVYPLGHEMMTIGRKADNTIVLPTDDLRASRHHATITYENGRYMLNDVGSINGTFLNDQRLTETQRLANGDEIRIGATRFEAYLPLPATQPRAPSLDEADTIISQSSPWQSQTQAATDDTLPRGEKSQPPENPYVGPRTFTRRESDRFYGREVEARELLSLVISERLVLFYAQSGAGKSSLINTRLTPQLQEAGYAVLPVGRVSGELPQGVDDVANIYVFNLLLSMDESDSDPGQFTEMNLADFLARLTSLDGVHYYYDSAVKPDASPAEEGFEPTPYVLLIDQFEEIVTTHAERWQERENFFVQLAQAMQQDPYLWVVLSLREDYVAALDAYAGLLPGHLRARFYMQRMSYSQALEAVKRPAEQYGRSFAPGVAESLVDNLRQIKVHNVQGVAAEETQLGQFVEPVQLQVVSYQLWENLAGRPAPVITAEDLQELGDVDLALAQFYEQALAEVIRNTDVSEIALRSWFESYLITEAGTRGTVYRGKQKTGGIDNRAIDLLANKFLLRSEVRTGGAWYELVHDRFIEPILQANREWRLRQPLIQVAHDWADSGRPDDGLLEGQTLKEALAGNWQGLGPLVKEFLEKSRAAQKAREEARAAEELRQAQALAEERQQRLDEQAEAAGRLRQRAMWITIIAVVAFLLAVVAGVFGYISQVNRIYAQEQADAALTAEAEARLSQAEAELSRQSAVAAEATARAESTAAAANAAEAKRLLEAQQATQTLVAAQNQDQAAQLSTRSAWLAATLTVQAATLEAPTLTPTYTPIPPTATPSPTGTFTPPPTDTPAATPTTTATPTPNMAATALVQNVQAELMVIATQQVIAAEITSLPERCNITPTGAFAGLWRRYSDDLGCPNYAEPVGGYFAEQPFENGYMTWSAVLDEIFVMVGEESGWWEQFDKAQVDAFNPTDTGSCRATPPEGLVQPIRGFGAIWCGNDDIREEVGFGLRKEFPGEGALLQEYNNGYILRDSESREYMLFKDSGEFLRFD